MFDKEMPSASSTPRSHEIDPEDQAKGKACAIVVTGMKVLADALSMDFPDERQDYAKAPLNENDYSPPSSPGGSRNVKL